MNIANNGMPKVSVIIPCYNQGGYVQDALDSCEAAYRGNLEIIIVDDGSTDPRSIAALEMARTRKADLRVLRKKNGGLSSARNVGVAASTGEFIQLLDADDLLMPEKIDAQIDHFAIVPDLDVSISNFLLCDELRVNFSAPDTEISTSLFGLDDFLYKWERGLSIPIHCGLFRRAVLRDVIFDEAIRAKEDWVFWCFLKLSGAKLAYIPMRGAVYRQHVGSMRRSYLQMADNWICAGAKIREKLPHGSHAGFMETVVSWHSDFYRRQPSYQEELRASSTHTATTREKQIAQFPAGVEGDLGGLQDRLVALQSSSVVPVISVVVPIYNHYDFLFDCLNSVTRQTGVPLEIICVEDASPDSRVGQFLSCLIGLTDRLTVIRHEKNMGISASQNEAVGIAKGEYIAFLDCDDVLPDDALTRILAEIRIAPDVDYFFTDRWDIDENGKILRYATYGGYDNIHHDSARDIRSDLLDGMVASHLKVIRKVAYTAAGGTRDEFSGIQDWELALKIAEHGTLRYIPEPLYRHRIHAGSVTRSEFVRQMRNTNILRRTYLERWLSKGKDGSVSIDWPRKSFYASASSPLDTEALRQAWRDGYRCAFVLGDGYSPTAIGFLREYNSYFDEIVCADPISWIALIGYIWDDILIDAKRLQSNDDMCPLQLVSYDSGKSEM